MPQVIKKVAAIDLGTNSFLCLIAEVGDGRVLSVIEDHCTVVRLGEGVHASRKFAPQALARAQQCLAEFRTYIDKHGVNEICAVATSAARDVSNSSELLELGSALRIPIRII